MDANLGWIYKYYDEWLAMKRCRWSKLSTIYVICEKCKGWLTCQNLNVVHKLSLPILHWSASQVHQTFCYFHIKVLSYIHTTLELFIKSLKEGWNYGFDPSLRKLPIKSLLACYVLEPIMKIGWNFWDLLFPPLNRVRAWDMMPWIMDGLYKASLAHPSQ